MAPNANQEHHKCWNNKKKMEGDDNNGVKTIDCLRARLLAERNASKLANEETLFLGHKLTELENKLKKETKLRNKADNKLRSLIKKLQSLNIISPSLPALDSYLSDSSEITDFSSTSSSARKHSHSISLIQHQHSPSSGSGSGSGSEGPSMEREKEKVDNSMAIVAVGLSTVTKSSGLITVNKNVSEVLAALKNAREKLQMERKRNYIYD